MLGATKMDKSKSSKRVINKGNSSRFMKTSTPTATEDKSENRSTCSQDGLQNSRTVMYSPITRIGNSSTYMSDSSQESTPHSSQHSQEQVPNFSENSVKSKDGATGFSRLMGIHNTENRCSQDGLQKTSPKTVMYSPITRIGNSSFYMSDSSQENSPHSSQHSQGQGSKFSENSVESMGRATGFSSSKGIVSPSNIARKAWVSSNIHNTENRSSQDLQKTSPRTMMYSPITRIGNSATYVSDSSQENSRHSSQHSQGQGSKFSKTSFSSSTDVVSPSNIARKSWVPNNIHKTENRSSQDLQKTPPQKTPPRTVMYTPVTRIGNSATYVTDSSQESSLHSSQHSQGQGSEVGENSVESVSGAVGCSGSPVVVSPSNITRMTAVPSYNHNTASCHSQNKSRSVSNQDNMLDLMKTNTPIAGRCELENRCQDGQQKSRRTLMFTPIKKIGNSTTYVNENSSSQSSQGSKVSDKPVVKQLVQKRIEYKSKKPRNDISKQDQKQLSFLEPNKPAKMDDDFAKYFENDDFDMNAEFETDMADEMYSEDEDTKIIHFGRLPSEVLENIFCQLPMLDLCLNSNLVCLQWNEIIADAKFVRWKKLYHKLKKDLGTSRRDVQAIMHKNGMLRPANYLDSLIRYMKESKPVLNANMLQCLQKHSLYHWAKALIDERLTDCLTHGDPNPWCVITILVIVSHDVYQIQEIIRCLTVSTSQCTCKEIIECLYCIATFLYAFKLARKADVWNGMHYRLFYALYLYENASTSSGADLHLYPGVDCSSKYSRDTGSVGLTHEQLRIVKHQTRADEVIKIVAFAGTGKTTTLVKYTQLRPDKKFLLVVYNKSVSDYARKNFPHNVTCKTGHALAYTKFGQRYASKLNEINVYTLTQRLERRKGENLFIRAKCVMTTIEKFFASADPRITTHHVPEERINEKKGTKEPIDEPAKVLYVSDAEHIWRQMQDPNNKKIGMSHDGYLKLYQQSKPSLREYDCILIDEAQDLTPAITDIILNQPQCKILVGDPHQQIYSFRGAKNAMDSISADTVFYLTQSFRFGPEIARVAACCLEELKNVKQKTLVGSGNKCTVMGEQEGQVAVISRCNSTVFDEAVKKCCYSDEPCKIAFVGGTKNFGFSMIMDLYTLRLSPEDRRKGCYEIQNKFIKNFKTFADLEKFALQSEDKELLGKIKIVGKHHNNLPTLIDKIESKCVWDLGQADFVFSTAHKAKGLEFSTVRVSDDFMQNQQPTAGLGGIVGVSMAEPLPPDLVVNMPLLPQRGESSDEENLLYVAITRAKNALQMSPTILRVLNQAGERFQYIVLSEDLRIAGRTFKCKKSNAEFQPKALTLEKKSLQRGDGTELAGGLYSPGVLSEDLGSYANLLGTL